MTRRDDHVALKSKREPKGAACVGLDVPEGESRPTSHP